MKKKGSVSSKPRRLRLGIYGGTFDPIHHGHLILAHDVLEKLKLDAILFVPCGQSPLKTSKPLADNNRRLAMLRLAVKKEKRFWISRCELDRPAPSYSYDTAVEIREAFPRAELFWLIGADQFMDLDRWHRPDDLRKLVKFVLMLRGDESLKGKLKTVLSLPQPRRIDISATEIRHRVKSRQPIDHLVPTPIAAYIKRHGLYLS